MAEKKGRRFDPAAASHGPSKQQQQKWPEINNDGTDDPLPVRKPLIVPNWEAPRLLTEAQRKPFEMDGAQIDEAFKAWSPSAETLTDHLWRVYSVRAVPEDTKDEDGIPLSPEQVFEVSVRRHVALFYWEYLQRGGRARRMFPIPVCRDIYLHGGFEEKRDHELDKLAGSQASLTLKEIPYHWNGERAPFQLNASGNAVLIAKYFGEKSDADKQSDATPTESAKQQPPSSKHGAPPKDKQADPAHRPTTAEQDALGSSSADETAYQGFAREMYALDLVQHPSVVHAVCYEKIPRPKILMPFLRGGDLIPLDADIIAWELDEAAASNRPEATRQRRASGSARKVAAPSTGRARLLSPDDSFLPHFFRQLVEAVFTTHQAGILHFDLKPENFVINGPDRNFYLPLGTKALQHYRLVLIDFGLAMRTSEAAEIKCMKSGTSVTMAPEQMLCNHRAGPGTDWWGVAAAMWRTRVFWEPTLTSRKQRRLLRAKCPNWGHPILPMQSFMSEDFVELMELLLKPSPKERNFSENVESIMRLLEMPYLRRGMSEKDAQTQRAQLEAIYEHYHRQGARRSTSRPSGHAYDTSTLYEEGSDGADGHTSA